MQAITQQIRPFDDRLLGWWYRIAAPPEVSDEAPLRDRMRVRSGRLTSVIFLVEIIFSIVGLIGSVLNTPYGIPLVLVTLITLIIGTILNRRGKTILAGVIVIVILTAGLALGILFTPGGLTASLLPIFDFFAINGLIAASLPLPWLTLPITLFDCLFTMAALTLLPKSPEIAKLMQTQPFVTYSGPLEIQIIVAVMTFLWVSSTYREMNRANSAEEVSKLTMEIAMQQQVAQEEKQQLEESAYTTGTSLDALILEISKGFITPQQPVDRSMKREF